MGKRARKTPKQKRRVPASERPRKLTSKGTLKHKRGDLRLVTSRDVGFAVKQKKGGAWVRSGERKCNVHTVCNCVQRTDPAKMRYITNR